MASVSTHVLDAVAGRPAIGVSVTLADEGGTTLAAATTDDDGRVSSLASDLPAGTYRIRFDTGAWFAAQEVETFYPEVVVAFRVTGTGAHHHVPILLSPFAFSTYRGS